MTANGVLQLLLFFGLILLLTKPMGAYMARVFQGERTLLTPVLRPVERLFYRLFGVREDEDMKWTTYAFAMLMFSVVGRAAHLRAPAPAGAPAAQPAALLRARR